MAIKERIKSILLDDAEELEVKEKDPVENAAKLAILECKTLDDIRRVHPEVQKVFDGELLSMGQMISIGELYQKQVGRAALLDGVVPDLQMTLYETEEKGVLTSKK